MQKVYTLFLEDDLDPEDYIYIDYCDSGTYHPEHTNTRADSYDSDTHDEYSSDMEDNDSTAVVKDVF